MDPLTTIVTSTDSFEGQRGGSVTVRGKPQGARRTKGGRWGLTNIWPCSQTIRNTVCLTREQGGGREERTRFADFESVEIHRVKGGGATVPGTREDLFRTGIFVQNVQGHNDERGRRGISQLLHP